MLLVSCCGDKGALYTVDEEKKIVEKVSPFDCTGIAKSLDGNIFAYSHSLKSIIEFDRNFIVKQSKEVGHNFHGLTFTTNNNLYAVDTYNDIIWLLDSITLEGRVFWDFRKNYSDLDENIPNDLYHINDMFVLNHVAYISMFIDFLPTEEQRPLYNGKVYTKNLLDGSNNFGQLFMGNLIQPHSPFWYGDEFYVCNSKRGSIIVNSKEIELGLGFTRGLLVTEDKVYVGISNSIRKTTDEEFKDSICGVAVLEKNSLLIMDFVPLPSNEVYAILWI